MSETEQISDLCWTLILYEAHPPATQLDYISPYVYIAHTVTEHKYLSCLFLSGCCTTAVREAKPFLLTLTKKGFHVKSCGREKKLFIYFTITRSVLTLFCLITACDKSLQSSLQFKWFSVVFLYFSLVCILPLVCNLQSAFYPWSAVCSLGFTLTGVLFVLL